MKNPKRALAWLLTLCLLLSCAAFAESEAIFADVEEEIVLNVVDDTEATPPR